MERRPAYKKLQSTPQNNDFSHEEEDNDEDEDDEEELITKEKFYRNLMGLDNDETGRSGKNKSNKKDKGRIQRPHDNRDQLPFLVQVITPPKEPYKKKKKHKKKGKKKSNNDDHEEEIIIGETLGEYKFDKSTNCGDKIEIDNEIYIVQRSKCQYKYAGAQKFVMVRKVLHVKPVERAMQEDYILRQWNAGDAPDVL